MVPLLRASAVSLWPTTVSRHFKLLAFTFRAVGFDWSIKRRDDSILSQLTFSGAGPAFLAVASQSGVFQHGSSPRVNCSVA